MAFEMARRLTEQGEKVGFLALLDTRCPEQVGMWRRRTASAKRLAYFAARAGHHLVRILNPGTRDRAAYFRDKKRVLRSLVVPDSPVRKSNERALRSYLPGMYSGRVHLFWAGDQPVAPRDRRWGWGRLAMGGMEARKAPGDHLSMMREPNLKVVASLLKACLDKADAGPI